MSDGSTRDGLQNVMAGLGTDRDKMSYGSYVVPKMLDRNSLESIYRGSWIARKIIDIPAEDMTREWRAFMFDDEDAQERNQFALETAEKKLAVRSEFRRAIKWARLYGGAMLLVGVGNNYESPLDPAAVRRGDLRFVRAFDRWTCMAEGEIDWDIDGPNFGLPKYYRIGTPSSGARVHGSRIIRFVGDELPFQPAMSQQQWGDSVLQVLFDTLLQRDTVTASIATMMFEANVDVIKYSALSELLATQEGEQKVIKRFQLAMMMKSFNRVFLLNADEEYDKKSNSFAGLDSIMREMRAEIAGAADIPVTRLFGTGVSGLNATGDNEVTQYYDMVRAKQHTILEPSLARFDEVFVRSVLGNMPDDYRNEFKPLWQMSQAERADADLKNAQRDQIYVSLGIATEGMVARELKERGTYSSITEADVELAEELSEASNEARVAGLEAAANGDDQTTPADDGRDEEEDPPPQKIKTDQTQPTR